MLPSWAPPGGHFSCMTHGVLFRDYSEILLHLRVIYLQACVGF